MFTCARISDVEYYLAEAEAAAENGAAPEGRDSAAYYLDNGAGEDKGVWWTPGGKGMVARGGVVDPAAFRKMARGVDPTTGEPLVQTNTSKRLAGYDMQFAAPKSVSVLWASGSPEQRARLEVIHQRAVTSALDGIRDMGLVITRRGKSGTIKEGVEDCTVAQFMHTTSRAGDPQLHSHGVLLNVCERKDGTYGTLDNARILQYQGCIGAMYRAELAKGLEDELGLSISRDARAFKVDGIPDGVVDLFSKRRAAIEDAAEKAGYTTAGDRERARLAAVATRDRKGDVPGREELERKWTRELQNAGWSKDAIWSSAQGKRESVRQAGVKAGMDPDRFRVSEVQRAGVAAIETLEANNAVFERRHLLCEVMERMQGLGGIEDAHRIVDELERDGLLAKVGTLRDGLPVLEREGGPENAMDEVVYASPRMVRMEQDMLRGVQARASEREFVPAEKVEAAIARKEGMSDEQAAAVRHALNRDGVSVIEGSAGTGKSYSLGGVADAARDAGLHVYVVAPSHKAKEVIRHDTVTDEDSAKAVQGFIRRLDPRHKDSIALTAGMAIIVDEAGMVGTQDMAALLHHAREAGAKVILAGDTRQLQPVAAGGPMAAIARTVGTQRIEAIRRQEKDWQRVASHDFATGNADRALSEYARRGRLEVAEGYEEALAALAKDWRRDVERNPEAMMRKPHEARLVVTGRNKDVHALNAVLRDAYREAGRLQGEDVVVEAFTRGQNGKLEPMALAAGDRLIFGEAVTIGDVTVNNSDMGTVEAVQAGKDGNPHVRVRLDKGEVLEGPWGAFTGWREEDALDATKHPKVQHAYAVTVHASQGSTVDRCYAFNGHGMGMESAYVSMTRHRHDAKMYVDGSRIADRLERQRQAKTFAVSGSGKADTADADEDLEQAGEAADREALAKVVCAEVMRSETKRNVSDFVADRRAWLNGEMPQQAAEPSPPTPPMNIPTVDQVAHEQAITIAALDGMVAEGAAAPRPFAIPSFLRKYAVSSQAERTQAVPTPPVEPGARQQEGIRGEAGRELERRMAERKQGPAYPMTRVPISTGMRGLSPSAELEVFSKEIDLPSFLESRGYHVAKQWRGGLQMRNGDSVLQVANREGRWVWTTPDGTENGSIVGYMQKVERAGNLGEVRKQLRAHMGEGADVRGLPVRAMQPREAAPAPVREYDFPRIRRFWAGMGAEANEWLEKARGIKREVLERFRADIRTEGQGSKQNPGGACFAHRNEAGEVVGYQRKGPKKEATDARGFSMWSKDGQKLLTRMGDRDSPQVVYVGETAIDLLSVYQHDRQPARALLCALDGASSKEALDEVAKLAVKHSEARFILAFDNDLEKRKVNPHTGEVRTIRPAGEVMAERVEEAVRAAAPEARLERHFPPAAYKDWNDLIRGVTRDQADQAHREADDRAKAQQAAEAARFAVDPVVDLENRISLLAYERREGILSGDLGGKQQDDMEAELRRMQEALMVERMKQAIVQQPVPEPVEQTYRTPRM